MPVSLPADVRGLAHLLGRFLRIRLSSSLSPRTSAATLGGVHPPRSSRGRPDGRCNVLRVVRRFRRCARRPPIPPESVTRADVRRASRAGLRSWVSSVSFRPYLASPVPSPSPPPPACTFPMSPWVIFPLSGRSSGRWRFGFVPLLPVLASVAGYSVTPFGGVCISSLGMGFSRFSRPASVLPSPC